MWRPHIQASQSSQWRRHRRPVGVGMLLQLVWWLTSSCVDQARRSCVNTEPGQAEAWPSAISVFLHTLTSGCLTSGSNRQPRDSIILHLSFCSHHSCLVSLFDAFNKTDTTIRITSHKIQPELGTQTHEDCNLKTSHCHFCHVK